MEIWTKWAGGFKIFGFLLTIIFSRRLQQLNIPLDPLDAAKGFESNIYKLKNENGQTQYTLWYRILKIYG